MEQKIPYKTYLSENEIPTKWYNVRADMKTKPAPLVNPGTGKPLTIEEMNPIFCEELNKMELDNDTKWFDIPEEVLSTGDYRDVPDESRIVIYLA
jgi:tryptophan synthase beta chain